MQRDSHPFALSPFAFHGDFLSEGGLEVSRALFLGSILFFGGGGMDLSKVGEKIFSSVRSARSLGILPSTSDRPEVPARAAAAAAVARVLAGLPPHQRHTLSSSSEELSSIYGSTPQIQDVEELEEEFYEEEFDPVRHVLEHVPAEDNELSYFEEKAALRLVQLDKISECLSRTVMQHHEEMVKGMQLVKELEKDLKVASVICMNGRRHLISSRNEVSRDLIVTKNSKKKQALLDMLPILTELRHALDMQVALETHVDDGNFFKAFQILSEYLQLLDSLSELSAVQEMSRGVEVWLSKTLQKLDALLFGLCRDFRMEGYVTVLDAYALIGDVAGLAEKIQSFFMQEILSETHAVLKNIVQEDLEASDEQSTCSRLTYSDLCGLIPESKFRQCLLETLAVFFKLMCSYYAIMSFQPENEEIFQTPHSKQNQVDAVIQNLNSNPGTSLASDSFNRVPISSSTEESSTSTTSMSDAAQNNGPTNFISSDSVIVTRDGGSAASSSESPWFQLLKDAAVFVCHALQRGRKNLWQLITTRVSVLLSSAAACSPSIHQFLINYEDLNTFILAGEAFCGIEAVEFRQKVKIVCEKYFAAFHRQNIYALKLVIEKENWLTMSPETIRVISFAGLIGDGAALIAPANGSPDSRVLRSSKSTAQTDNGLNKSGFSHWLQNGNPFSLKMSDTLREQHDSFISDDSRITGEPEKTNNEVYNNKTSQSKNMADHVNENASVSEDENEDLHADFIDEDSQLPSRISKPKNLRNFSSHWNNEEIRAQTGSSLCLLRLMDKYARLMQKLEIANVEFFKGICQLFGIFFHFVFETFCNQNGSGSGKGLPDSLSYRLKSALSRIKQDCNQWIKHQSLIPSPTFNSSLIHMDVAPSTTPNMNYGHPPCTSFGLKERCAAADSISLVAQLLHRSKAHLHTMLLQSNPAIVDDFYGHLVDAVPDLTEAMHRTTAKLLLHINGRYVDRIANAKWEVRELGLEHNGYVDLLLGEFKHYKTRIAHGGIRNEAQDLLLEYGLENVAETLVEGLSRVKRCTEEGRALMSLDLQVLINGLRHFASIDVKPKFLVVETFIKAYYLPETEFVHWARAHPEYSKSQIIGLINLVATMKSWKRKTKTEILEKIE